MAGATPLKRTLETRRTGPTIASNEVRVWVGAFERLGYDSQRLLAAAGLREADLEDPDARLPCAAYTAILTRAQEERFTPNLALHLARSIPIGAYPLLDYLVLTCDTVGAGVRQLSRYFALVGVPVEHEIEEDKAAIRVVIRAQAPFSVEFNAALMILHLREETEGSFSAASVNFAHTPDDSEEYTRVLGCPVNIGASWNGVRILRQSWQLPLRRRDPLLRTVLERHANEVVVRLPAGDGIVAEVQRLLAAHVAGGDIRIEVIARRLVTSARTLQRRLAAEGVSFQELVDRSRREAAAIYIADSTLPICEIAFLLGYSEPAPFHRAFKRWYRTTPEAFRKAARHAAAGLH